MTTKEALHEIVDRLPDDEARANAVRAILEYVATLPKPQLEQLVGVVQRQRTISGITVALSHDEDDTAAWTHLSIPAFARDWESDEDSIYDNESLR